HVLVEELLRHLILDRVVAVLAETAPRRLRARDRRPHHRRAGAIARIRVPVADDTERALGRHVLVERVVTDVAVIERPPGTLIVGQREAAGGVVLPAEWPPAVQRVRSLDADRV